MSTKVSIRHRLGTPELPGFHLYDDVMDDLGPEDSDAAQPVYLMLEGVGVELERRGTSIVSVTLTLPRELARELGLLREERAAGQAPKS